MIRNWFKKKKLVFWSLQTEGKCSENFTVKRMCWLLREKCNDISSQSIFGVVTLTEMVTGRAEKEMTRWKPLVTLKNKAGIGFRKRAKIASESLWLPKVSLWETEGQAPRQSVMSASFLMDLQLFRSTRLFFLLLRRKNNQI